MCNFFKLQKITQFSLRFRILGSPPLKDMVRPQHGIWNGHFLFVTKADWSVSFFLDSFGSFLSSSTKKSRILETLNLLTNADHRTNNFFFWGGLVKKKIYIYIHVTRDMWHVTRDTWHVTCDMCHLSHVTIHLSLQEQPQPQTLPFVTCPVGAQ